MSYLLDTNIVSELRKGARCDPGVSGWFSGIAEDQIFLSVLVAGEIRRGIEVVRGTDPGKAAVLERWLENLVREHGERVLPIDQAVADLWGRLSSSRSLSVVDGLLAATALVHGLTLVTRNAKHVAATGVDWLNPFESDRKRPTREP